MRFFSNLAVLCTVSITMGVEAQQIPQINNPSGQATMPRSNVPPQIAAIREQWAIYLQTKKIDPLMALYTKDAMFLDSTGERIIGQAAIRNLCRQVMAAFNANLTLYSIRSESSGELAYESGNYMETLTPTVTGAAQTIHGSYIMVFKLQPDGTWRIMEQMWTEAPPAAPTPPVAPVPPATGQKPQ